MIKMLNVETVGTSPYSGLLQPANDTEHNTLMSSNGRYAGIHAECKLKLHFLVNVER